MLVRRPAAFALLLGLSGALTLTACAAEEDRGPSLRKAGDETTDTPAKKDPPVEVGSPTDDVEPGSEQTDKTDTTATPEVKKELGITWFGQEKYYFCGPGSTKMALSALVQTPPSQDELGALMGTTTEGTSDVGKVCKAINKYVANANYVVREISDPATPAQRDQLKKDLVARVSAGFPIVANVISGWRPAGYPSGTIYHYVAVVGYDESGEKALIADPAAEGSGGANWKNVKRTYWVSIDDLATWIGGKGYTG